MSSNLSANTLEEMACYFISLLEKASLHKQFFGLWWKGGCTKNDQRLSTNQRFFKTKRERKTWHPKVRKSNFFTRFDRQQRQNQKTSQATNKKVKNYTSSPAHSSANRHYKYVEKTNIWICNLPSPPCKPPSSLKTVSNQQVH